MWIWAAWALSALYVESQRKFQIKLDPSQQLVVTISVDYFMSVCACIYIQTGIGNFLTQRSCQTIGDYYCNFSRKATAWSLKLLKKKEVQICCVSHSW